MAALIALLLFLLGASLASFAGLAVHRLRALPTGESVRAALSGRSCCEGCAARLDAWELVPVLGWLAARGRCRRCGQAVPVVYPVTEAISGAAVAGAFHVGGLPGLVLALAAAVVGLVALVVFLALRRAG